tara:strand:- start:7141 stop:8310 length:1170 start_codon:yes stop_codon:yes gene_type:complete
MTKKNYYIYFSIIFFLCNCSAQNTVTDNSENTDTKKISSIEKSEESLTKKNLNDKKLPEDLKSKDIESESIQKVVSTEKSEVDSLLSYAKNQKVAADALMQKANIRDKALNAKSVELDVKNKELDAKSKDIDSRVEIVSKRENRVKELLNDARLDWLKEMAVYILLFLSLFTALFLSLLVQKIYTWRKKINGSAIILPEEISDEMDNSRKEIKMLLRKIGELSSLSTRNNNLNSEYFNDINEALKPLKDTISSQRDEIKRLQNGYDNHIKKSFVRRLIDLRDRISFYTVDNSRNTAEVVEATKNILKIVDYTFKTEGIKTISFKNGDPLKNLDADEVDILEDNAIESKDSELAGTIKDTLSPCYYLDGSDGKKEVIKKGMVAFYKSKGN